MEKQYILTRGSIAADKTNGLFQLLHKIAMFQNDTFHEHISEASHGGENRLSQKLRELAAHSTLDPEKLIHYFGGIKYPTSYSIAIYDSKFDRSEDWSHAASDHIGSPTQHAKILPADMPTADAEKHLREHIGELESNGITPVILEISDNYAAATIQRSEAIGTQTVDIVTVSPHHAMDYLCRELGLGDCRNTSHAAAQAARKNQPRGR